MRILKTLAAATALASLAVAPVIAQASGASKLSLRSSTHAKKANELAPALIGVLIAIVVVGGVVVATESSDSP